MTHGEWTTAFATPARSVMSPRRIGRLEASIATAAQVTGTSFPKEEIVPSGDLVRYAPQGHPWDYLSEQMDRDPDLAGMLYRLYEAMLSLRRRIIPRDKTDGAGEAASMVRECISALPHWGQHLFHLVRHVGEGIAPLELNWTGQGGVYRPYEAWPRPKRYLAFLANERGEAELHVRRADAPDGRIRPDPWKFLWPVRDLLYYPWGRGLKELLCLYWRAKHFTVLDWQAFNEQWLKPILKAKYKGAHTGDPQKDRELNREIEADLLKSLLNVFGDGAVVHEMDTSDVGTLSAQMAGNAGFREFIETIARSMARLILAEINTIGLRPGVGAYASDEIGYRVSHQKTCLAGHDLCAYLGDTLFRWLVQANLPGAPVPRMIIDMTSEEASRILMEGAAEALKHGFPELPKSHLKNAWRIPDLQPGDEYYVPPPQDASFVVRKEAP